MPLTTKVKLNIQATLTKAPALGVTPSDPLNLARTLSLASGIGAGQADQMYYGERQLAASSSEDFDLVGSVANTFGVTVSLARVKLLYVEALATNVNDVLVGGAAATQWAAFLGAAGVARLRPGAIMLLTAGQLDQTGYVCAAGATDLLKIANSGAGTPVTYRIAIIGATA